MAGRDRYKVMSNKLEPKADPGQPMAYQIRIKGHLSGEWDDWFEGLTVTLEKDGNTLLTGLVNDQAALLGFIKKVRDLGLTLISVSPVESGPGRSRGTGKSDEPEDQP